MCRLSAVMCFWISEVNIKQGSTWEFMKNLDMLCAITLYALGFLNPLSQRDSVLWFLKYPFWTNRKITPKFHQGGTAIDALRREGIWFAFKVKLRTGFWAAQGLWGGGWWTCWGGAGWRQAERASLRLALQSAGMSNNSCFIFIQAFQLEIKTSIKLNRTVSYYLMFLMAEFCSPW